MTKVYCGKAKYIEGKYGPYFEISLSPTDIDKITEYPTGSGWTNLRMVPMRNPDARGNTHTVYYVARSYINGTFDFSPKPDIRAFPENELKDAIPF